MSAGDQRPDPQDILRDLGMQPRLTVYLAYAPGAGKTHRLLSEARALWQSGAKVALGWIETKGRADLESLADGVPRIPARTTRIGDATFEDFDLEAALASDARVIVLDELAHTNLAGGRHVKRWEDALALKAAGRSVLGALNVQHLENVAPTAEALIGMPVREIVPASFLRAADQVVAVDVSPEQIEARLHEGRIVRREDIERALLGPFRPHTLRALRALLLQTIEDVARARGEVTQTSIAVAFVPKGIDVSAFVTHAAAFADAMNLALEIAPLEAGALDMAEQAARVAGARVATESEDWELQHFFAARDVPASFIALPLGDVARRLVGNAVDRDVLVVDDAWAAKHAHDRRSSGFHHAFGQTLADRQRIGYGKLTVYLGAAAGCGKTYAMLDRAHQLQDGGVDVLAALIETHGRAETERLIDGLHVLPRKRFESSGITYEELDVDALLARRPQVALIDELAHTNAPGSVRAKRYMDVLTVVRAGISVITTLNVQHLEGLNDVVKRLTGVNVRETIADAVLEFADEVVLIDASPETLRDRLRAGKIYPKERVEAALASFFQTENLLALRELAVREALRVRRSPSKESQVGDLVLGVAPRERDKALIQRATRIANRLGVDLHVVHVARPRHAHDPAVRALESAALGAGASWTVTVSDRPHHELARRALTSNAVLAVEGARAKPGLLRPPTFARRLLDAGAPEVLVLAPARA